MMVGYTFHVGLFHSLLFAGFNRRFRRGRDTRRRVRPALPDARLIHRIIHQRRLRGKFLLPDLFADPAWDILLDLTAARWCIGSSLKRKGMPIS